MNSGIIPKIATVISENSICIDFTLYSDKKCEIKKMSRIALVKKILIFIKQVGKCQDISELQILLKAHNSCDMSKSGFQKMMPEGLKVYEIWHKKHTGERIIYTRSANIFYPIIFLQNHPS